MAKKTRRTAQFTLHEIKQLINWWKSEFSGSEKLYYKLLRIQRKLKKDSIT